MYAKTALALAAALFSSAGAAAPTQRDTESGLFNLFVTSSDDSKRYQNSPLGACHSGAATYALCVVPGIRNTFTFNATDAAPAATGSTNPGQLVFTTSGTPMISQGLSLEQNSTSNVGAGFFQYSPSGTISVAFTQDDYLLRVVSDREEESSWYVCDQTSEGYEYETVSWVAPGETPDNADCSRVNVNRVFN